MKTSPLILITGAAGMIGSCLVRHLNDIGHSNLLLVDDLKKGDKWKNLVGKQFVSLISKHQLFSWLENHGTQVSAIIHLGACSDTMELDGDYLLENNYRYTIRLAEWALSRNLRFIYASSAATYGDGSLGFEDDESCLQQLRPLNMYGYSKHLVDLWMKRENVLDKVVGLKYFNVYGPNEYHKAHMASMVLKMTQKADLEGSIDLFKSNDPRFPDGGQCRDFIYVKDVVKMTASFLQSSASGIFNIGQGKVTTWNQLAHALFAALEKPAKINYVDMPVGLAKQYQNYTCASMDKFHRLNSSGSESALTTSITDAVKDYVQEYLMRNARW